MPATVTHRRCRVGLLLLLCGLCCGCGRQPARPLALVVSGDLAGHIVPCGCTSNQSGGLPRRGTYLKQLRDAADVIVAEVGGAPGGTSHYDQLKFAAVLRGEQAIGVAAHNIGAAEAALGPETLLKLATDAGVPLVSANTTDTAGRPLAAAVRILVAGGCRLAVVGVLSPRYATAAVRVAAPQAAVLEALQTVAGKYDAVCVLAYLPDEELGPLAEHLPEVDVVCGGPTGQPVKPKSIGPVLLASATREGKFLVRFDRPADAQGAWSGQIVELTDFFADDQRQVENVDRLYEDLTVADLTPDETSFASRLSGTPASYRVAGNAACEACHLDDARVWKRSGHAQAWKSLVAKGAHVDPECQRCHTTGYGAPGGFRSVARSSTLVDVGCEDCHGPSQGHVANPKTPTPFANQARYRCRRCHDDENSPQFVHESYWAKIRHGDVPATADAANHRTESPKQ